MVPQLCTALLVVLSLHLDATVAECQCGKNNLDHRIVGGNESQVHEWPWQVYLLALVNEKREGNTCGGSLISPSWVLTAAHCVKRTLDFMKLNGITNYLGIILVSIGDHDLFSGSDTSHTKIHPTVRQVIVHDDYVNNVESFKLFNDIAVIELVQPVEYSHGILPVCLPTNLRNQLFVGEHATVAGWGHTSNNDNSGSNVVLDVTHPIITNTECENMYYDYGFRIRDDQVCTYEEGKSACSGDSGGPLVWLDDSGHYQQIGIVSFGTECAGKDRPGIYTRVTSYIDWIEEKTNTNFCSP